MGAKCSKNSARNASENADADARRDLENKTSLRSTGSKQNLLQELASFRPEGTLSHLDSAKSSKHSDSAPATAGSFHDSMSMRTGSQLSFKDKNGGFLNQTSGLNKPFGSMNTVSSRGSSRPSNRGSFHEFSNPSKQSSMVTSLPSFASTNDSDSVIDNTVEMRSFTPFDMKKTDELAQFFVTQCGLGLSSDHNPLTCKICQTVDLSDAPLIA
ncbi:conserved hypothetical protein [Theileria orientalis strain Shintoku]|uniref:Uncharacterized protein n=1 Tax=Theileria orientalis strain Shintoku TaxID=869250 RepID=J4CCY9_THEOR|nr:conserved hypothetical protein [Theileria orientalis strain Shintoku]PVC51646.1 hypothetical protein MACL_00001464 [Theileria orientalis]BAM40222.1 conserved hypothetical protein [Theileria orientalis strain Shintoku]|eukprot:XP_009690523.1 conserved hypothetical protein [Theileria orientalis strain Shintoku]